MNIQVAVLCDAATVDNEKLNLLGAFDTVCAPKLPAVHPQCAVALRVTFTSEDEGRHVLTINLINADGRSMMPNFPKIPVDVKLPEDLHFLTRSFIVSFQHLQFPEAGLYSVDVRFDDVSRASIPLLVKHTPPPDPA